VEQDLGRLGHAHRGEARASAGGLRARSLRPRAAPAQLAPRAAAPSGCLTRRPPRPLSPPLPPRSTRSPRTAACRSPAAPPTPRCTAARSAPPPLAAPSPPSSVREPGPDPPLLRAGSGRRGAVADPAAASRPHPWGLCHSFALPAGTPPSFCHTPFPPALFSWAHSRPGAKARACVPSPARCRRAPPAASAARGRVFFGPRLQGPPPESQRRALHPAVPCHSLRTSYVRAAGAVAATDAPTAAAAPALNARDAAFTAGSRLRPPPLYAGDASCTAGACKRTVRTGAPRCARRNAGWVFARRRRRAGNWRKAFGCGA
jgi:hypothetical protein